MKVVFVFSDEAVVEYIVYAHVVSVLRIASEIISSKNICVEVVSVDKKIKRLSVITENAQILRDAIKEAAEIRCSHTVDGNLEKINILRQLPWEVVIEESNKIAKLGILHAIYASSRGGYNIKVFEPYDNPSLDHYCYLNSNKWD